MVEAGARPCGRADFAVFDDERLSMGLFRNLRKVTAADQVFDRCRRPTRSCAEAAHGGLDLPDPTLHLEVDEPRLPFAPRLLLGGLVDHRLPPLPGGIELASLHGDPGGEEPEILRRPGDPRGASEVLG